jgi:hypothetical protein
MLKGKAKILMFAACAESTLKRLNAVVRSILEDDSFGSPL